MATKVERIFYPIGQGAFYAERFHLEKGGDFNIVYDCGNSHNTKLGDKVVEQAFTKNDTINALFISHFDYDHVSKINKLQSCVGEIKKVFLPLLTDDEKKLLIFFSKIANHDVVGQLIEFPNTIFGDKTIIQIIPSQSAEPINLNENNFIDIESKEKKEIDSGTVFYLSGVSDWFFIPFNYKSEKRRAVLIERLKEFYDVEKLINDPGYVTDIIKDKKERKKIKDIYESIEGGINQNSLILYSGPIKPNQWHNYCISYPQSFESLFCRHRCFVGYDLFFDNVACVYTGDTDLNEVKIQTIYEKIWDYVGTIQIPHHGSLKSFDINEIKEHIFCPVSVGKNDYGHPSISLISQILSKHSLPILVKDDIFSCFIECFQENSINKTSESDSTIETTS